MKMNAILTLMCIVHGTGSYGAMPLSGAQKTKESDEKTITLSSEKVLHERLCKLGGVVNDFVCKKGIDKTLGGATHSIYSIVDIVDHEIEEYSHGMSHVPNIQQAIAAQRPAIIACILQASSKNEK